MLFDLSPKNRKEDFFNFEKELNELIDALRNPMVRMIAVKGLRRTGKSSLVRVALGISGLPYAIVDLREFTRITPTMFRRKLNELLVDSYMELSKRFKLPIEIEKVSLFGVTLKRKRRMEYRRALRAINELVIKKKTRFVLVVDEAQECKKFGFDEYLAFVYDNLEGIVILLTGSQIGIFEKMLENPESPLFGREYLEIKTRRLTNDEAKEFLRMGFSEAKINISEELIDKIVSELDGVIGWLNHYGWYFCQYKKHKEALARARRRALALAKKELRNFLKTRGTGEDPYKLILGALAIEPMRWKDIKEYLEIKLKREIPNNLISKYLRNLTDYGFITKEGRYYKIPDPITRRASRRLT